MALLKKELLNIHKKMAPKERINAFFRHSQLLTYLFEAGQSYRDRQKTCKAVPVTGRKAR